MVIPTFFSLSLNLAISSWSEPQSAPGLVFADCISFSIFGSKEYNQSDIGVGHLVMSCIEFSLVLLEDHVCYDQCFPFAELYYPLPCFILYSKVTFAYSSAASYLGLGCLFMAAATDLRIGVSPHGRRCWPWMCGVSFGCSPLQWVQQLLPLRKAQPPQVDGGSSVQTCFLSFKVPSPLSCIQWCSVHH